MIRSKCAVRAFSTGRCPRQHRGCYSEKNFPSGVRNLHKTIEIQPKIWYNKPIFHLTSYTRWSFNYPPGTVIPDGFVYGISYALFGIDSLSGYVLASRAPAGAWEPGAYLTREVQVPEETQPWFCSQETRPLLIMTEHGLGLLSKRYLPACGVGLLIHFHVPGKRGAAAVNRGLLQTDWIVSESVRAMGAGRCGAETYQVLTEAAYELSERLPALFPQPDRRTVRLRDVSDCICSMAAAIGCVAQEEPTRDGDTDRDQNRQVFCSHPRVWEAFLLYGLSLAWRMAAEYVRSAARAVCASSGVLNGDSGAFLTGYHCLTHASAYNGAILRYDLGNPVPAPDNRRLERRHLTLEMTMLNDPAVDSQMNLRSSATELFRF